MPSGHSHSSHSSSSHSSHSHSSHSSSHSSHSSTSHSSYNSTPRVRSRYNQPTGYKSISGKRTKSCYCKQHDYIYYPEDWYNDNGQFYREGYYDENGNYYKRVGFKNEENIVKCSFCDSLNKFVWKEGVVLKCENCGANLEFDIIDEKTDKTTPVVSNTKALKVIKFIFIVWLIMSIAPMLFISFIAAIFSKEDNAERFMNGVANSGAIERMSTIMNSFDDERTISLKKDSIYVEEIDRTLYLDGEDYYDSDSNCWVYFNREISPSQWQYWYNGISSDYGDYGWMEYDDRKEKWFIEVTDGKWEEVPSTYNTSNLWHFDNAFVDNTK